MKRRFPVPFLFMAVLALSMLFAACSAGVKAPASSKPSEDATPEQKVEALLASMTLKEKIGQMVMIGIHGTDVTEDSLFMLHQYHIGGIILFDRNMESQEQVKALNAHLQEKAGEKVPLFIGVDEEGGLVARMKDKLPPPPAEEEIGASGNPELAGEWAAKTAVALKDMGFNLNFAPVADLGMERGRSFSSDPAVAAEFVRSAAKGYRQENLIYCLKHFPGLGKGEVDTHKDTAVINISAEELRAQDLLPFRTVVEEEEPSNHFIMVSHAVYPALEECPASISRVIQTELLRKALGYDGVIIIDDIAMGAVSNYYSPEELAMKAVAAGTDIILSCHEYQTGTNVYLKLLEAAEQKQISEERINESVRRILRVKLAHLGTAKAGDAVKK